MPSTQLLKTFKIVASMTTLIPDWPECSISLGFKPIRFLVVGNGLDTRATAIQLGSIWFLVLVSMWT